MDWKAVGRRIKAARERAGLTQDELAARVGLSAPHVSCIERGVKPPKLDTFITIANATGVSSDILLQDVVSAVQNSGGCDITVAVNSLSNEDQDRVRTIIRAFASNQ